MQKDLQVEHMDMLLTQKELFLTQVEHSLMQKEKAQEQMDIHHILKDMLRKQQILLIILMLKDLKQ